MPLKASDLNSRQLFLFFLVHLPWKNLFYIKVSKFSFWGCERTFNTSCFRPSFVPRFLTSLQMNGSTYIRKQLYEFFNRQARQSLEKWKRCTAQKFREMKKTLYLVKGLETRSKGGAQYTFTNHKVRLKNN